jgi:hypothetical protein
MDKIDTGTPMTEARLREWFEGRDERDGLVLGVPPEPGVRTDPIRIRDGFVADPCKLESGAMLIPVLYRSEVGRWTSIAMPIDLARELVAALAARIDEAASLSA